MTAQHQTPAQLQQAFFSQQRCSQRHNGEGCQDEPGAGQTQEKPGKEREKTTESGRARSRTGAAASTSVREEAMNRTTM